MPKKEFSAREAKNLIEEHLSLIKKLQNISSAADALKNTVKSNADGLATEELLKTLRTVPVDEINRDKKGIRIKALKEYNYNTVADVYAATVYNIAAVRGIGADTAYNIKRIANNIANEALKQVKIKISADDKNSKSTALIKSIFIYKNSLPYIEKCKELLSENKRNITEQTNCLKPAANALVWLFTSKSNKSGAISAYDYLKEFSNNEYFHIANDTLTKFGGIKAVSADEVWESFSTKSIEFYNVLEEIAPGLLGNSDTLYGLPEDLAIKVQEECFFPDGLLCTLRRYQEWGVKYILHQGKVLLGDEMGLGKTIQAIAVMVSLRNTGATHFMVVCPASVLTNWCREIAKHSLLKVTKIHGNDRQSAFSAWEKTGGVGVTTFETVNSFDLDDNFMFSLIVVDEAHYIKNSTAKRTVNTQNLCRHAERALFMTGTALENKVDEMISLIYMLNPVIADQAKKIAFMPSASEFRNKIAAVYYRRKRDDVLTELPELIESKEWCTLRGKEEKVYEDAVLNRNFAESRRVSWNVDDLNFSSKAERLKEIVDEAESDGRKVIVFSFFLDTLNRVSLFLGNRCGRVLNGSVNPAHRQEIIDEFDKAPAGNVLVAQIQSGGTGLNIQSASVIVICEPQLKPSIENQAISRAYRMGQTRNVLVYRLLCENTVDERITKLLEEKQSIFNAFADKSVAAQQSFEVDDGTLNSIITDEIERINAKNGTKTQIAAGNAEYYNKLTEMKYNQIVEQLKEKYGAVPGDYFANESCRSKNTKISRTKEGLFCHHIDEDKAIMLSNERFSAMYSYDYQKANRLVYCNLLEHLLLHIKIAEEPRNCETNNNDLPGIGGAVNYIVKIINDGYNDYQFKKEYLIKAFDLIKPDYDSYILMLKRLYRLIEENKIYSLIFKRDELFEDSFGNVVEKIKQDCDI